MRKRIILILIGISSVYIIPAMYVQGVSSTLLEITFCLGSRTLYATNYHEINFLRITSGMDWDEVIVLLGHPLHEHDRPVSSGRSIVFWAHADGGGGTGRRRGVWFIDGRVSDIVADFVVD